VTARGIGGGHKQKIRLVDFKRNKHGVESKVAAIEYDPMRSARLALLDYTDGEKRYIIAPVGVVVGAFRAGRRLRRKSATRFRSRRFRSARRSTTSKSLPVAADRWFARRAVRRR
jgi:hypothetical protein